MSWVRIDLGDVRSMVQDSRSANPDVPIYMGVGIGWAQGWASHNESRALDRDPSQALAIDAVMRKVKRSPLEKSLERTFEGVFFPALLLFSGWWARSNGQKLAEAAEWGDGLQHWLFRGFEQWGPSWQVDAATGRPEQYLFGQIGGEGDEADSVALIVADSKAAALRERLSKNGPRAFGVRATGRLCHRSHVADLGINDQLRLWGRSFQYCLIVGDEKEHKVEPSDAAPSFYSGYLWKCLMPKSLAKLRRDDAGNLNVLETPKLHDVYFLWEHTDLTKADTVAYNLDSLIKKEEYLRHRLDDDELIMLQRSSDLIDGTPAMPTERFYQFINPERASIQKPGS